MNNIRRKLLLKSAIKLTPLFLIVVGGGRFVITTLTGGIINEKQNKELKELVTKKQEEIIELESFEIEPDESIETFEEPVDEVIEIEPQEEISSELLSSGYAFAEKDFETLKSINPDACGWIVIDDTIIDYPIVTASNLEEKDRDYYLKHNITGEKSSYGTLYVDRDNESLDKKQYELDDITYIFGHRMKNGSMFKAICGYQNQSFYDQHPYGIIYTPDGYAYQAEFFAGVTIDGTKRKNLYHYNFKDEEEFNNYISDLISKSDFESNVNVEFGDKIVALITCTYEIKEGRYVVFAKLSKQYINEMQIEKKRVLEMGNNNEY